MDTPPARLKPDMASFRGLVRVFIRDYIGNYGISPSQGEIARHFECQRGRVRDAIRSLERDGLVVRTPGPRGLRMPSEREEAVRKLQELGFVVNAEDGVIELPARPLSPLLPPPGLDYPPSSTEKGD